MSEPFIAEVKVFAGNFAPRNWAFCHGQLLSISQNTALFSLIGTTYGGDGRTTMGLPDLEGRVPLHPGRGPGLSSYRLGQLGGSTIASLSQQQMPTHNHGMVGFTNLETANPTSGRGLGSASWYAAPGTVVAMEAGLIGTTGGNQAHPNEQPYLAINYIIAIQGLYPSRN